jgi:hypothetical protein
VAAVQRGRLQAGKAPPTLYRCPLCGQSCDRIAWAMVHVQAHLLYPLWQPQRLRKVA